MLLSHPPPIFKEAFLWPLRLFFLAVASGDSVIALIRFARAARTGLGLAAHQIRTKLLGKPLFAVVGFGQFFSGCRLFSHVLLFTTGKSLGKAAFRAVQHRFPHYVKRNAIACLRFA
ncbi:hypothetical protein BMEI1665 [Brucella melitensis bv. 1 str. 16M]|uniref:Bacterial inner-membrane translocator n=2 Tax=Brucella TaxID=234 RepID=Q8YF62_BRUME|nr:hypothetical protein BMEI1665 [Brucella melitensis bv. 1 str. 16M]ABY37374.1 Hypothetical protein, conserved [Brucella suis ATCC 23445]